MYAGARELSRNKPGFGRFEAPKTYWDWEKWSGGPGVVLAHTKKNSFHMAAFCNRAQHETFCGARRKWRPISAQKV